MNAEEIKKEQVKGILLLLIGAFMLGGSGIFVKISDSSPSLIAFYRALLALPFLYIWMKYEERLEPSDLTLDKRYFFFIFLGGICFALDMSIWNWSLSFTSLASSTLMVNTAPVFVIVFGLVFLSYKINISFIAILCLAMLGIFLVVQPGDERAFFGDSLALIAAVFYAGYILSIKDLTNVIKPAKTLYYVTLVTSLCLLPLSFIEAGTLSISYDEFILLLIYALFSQTIAQGLITKGISKVSAHLSSLVLLMQPVAAALYGWLLLGEMFTPTQIIGGIIVLLAIYLASKN